MRHLITLIFFQVIFLNSYQSFGISEYSRSVKDVETQFIILEFPKYEKPKLQYLIAELNTYVGKIADVQFDESTHQMNIQYYSSIKLDDILQIVSAHGIDFVKISGSELE